MIFYYTAGFLDSQLSISYIDFQKFISQASRKVIISSFISDRYTPDEHNLISLPQRGRAGVGVQNVQIVPARSITQ